MSSIESKPRNSEEIVQAALAGDESAFANLAKQYRRELHVHCYRMLGSFDDAEDLVQETFLKAWAKRETFEGRSSFRAWLYRIATNGCLDYLARNRHRVLVAESPSAAESHESMEVSWLQPYPDRLLDQVASGDAGPDAAIVARETIELAYLVALQYLTPKQRAALILCDVLDWSAKETAELLELSVASVNGALQRARATLQEKRPPRRPQSSEQDRVIVDRYVAAANDAQAIAQLLREDVRFSMPPETGVYVGRDVVVNSWIEGGFGSPPFDDFRCLVTHANRMPAVACYVRRAGDVAHRPFAIDVLQIEDGVITEITAFDVSSTFEAFGLPATL